MDEEVRIRIEWIEGILIKFEKRILELEKS